MPGAPMASGGPCSCIDGGEWFWFDAERGAWVARGIACDGCGIREDGFRAAACIDEEDCWSCVGDWSMFGGEGMFPVRPGQRAQNCGEYSWPDLGTRKPERGSEGTQLAREMPYGKVALTTRRTSQSRSSIYFHRCMRYAHLAYPADQRGRDSSWRGRL